MGLGRGLGAFGLAEAGPAGLDRAGPAAAVRGARKPTARAAASTPKATRAIAARQIRIGAVMVPLTP
jgi:hypothetical protein